MIIFIILISVSISLSQYTLYIQHIYSSNYELNLDIYGKNISSNITINDIFDIIINNEKYENITLKCDLIGLYNISKIKCLLNYEGIFYITKNNLEKSFEIKYNEETIHYTLENNEDFYLLIIQNNSCNFVYQNLNYNIIPISMALDNGYIYPTIVSITSIMLNSNNRNKYEFYIMHPPDLLIENKNKLKSLENKYNRCKINLFDMGKQFIKAKNDKKITTPAYYRLSLSDLLPNINIIIWIDGDTLTFKDLKEFYDIDMNNLHYKGFLDVMPYANDHITFKNEHYICSGVLLINLNELRKDNMLNIVTEFIEKENEKLINHDQTIINAKSYNKTDILPPQFGIFNLHDFGIFHYLNPYNRYKYKYSIKDLNDAFNNPVILHCVNKPWKCCWKYNENKFWMNTFKYGWWFYAKQTDYYNEIIKKYPRNFYQKNKKIIKKILRIIIIILLIILLIFILKKRLYKN